MSNDPQVEQKPAVQTDNHAVEAATTDVAANTSAFTDHGAKPGVGHGAKAHKPSASELGFGGDKKHAPTDADWSDANSALQVAADLVQSGSRRLLANAPAHYAHALHQLADAVGGQRDGAKISSSERVQLFDQAQRGLRPAMDLVGSTGEGKTWIHDQLSAQLARQHDSLMYGEASDRVENSVLVSENGKKEVVEMPDDKHPHEQGKVLHAQLQKLIPTMATINEQVIRANHDGIHHEAEHMMEGHGGKKLGPGSLVELQHMLMLADAYLTLTDEEFQHHLHHVQGIFNGVATYTEFLKAVTELAGGCIGVSASYASVIAKLAGDTHSAAMAAGLSRSVGLVFANVVAGIEIVHGIAVMLDPHATGQEKLDGAAGAASGAAWFIGTRVAGAAVGAAASTAIIVGYAELKLMAQLYWEANLGIIGGWMRQAFDTIQQDGESIARNADSLAKCSELIHQEKDPAKLEALKHVQTNLATRLGESVDYFLDDCEPRGYGAGVARYPGAHGILQETFRPLKQYKGARTVEAATHAGTETLRKITWSLQHAGDLVAAEATHHHVADIEAADAKKQEGGGEGENKGHH